MSRGKGVKYTVMEGDWTLGGENTVDIRVLYYKAVHLKFTKLLTYGTPINVIKKEILYFREFNVWLYTEWTEVGNK